MVRKMVALTVRANEAQEIIQVSELTESVFPDPVCAIPTTSLPLRAIGQPCAWIDVGATH